MAKISDLEKLGEQSRTLGRSFVRAQARAFEEHEEQRKRMAPLLKRMAEEANVPFETRDVLIEMNRQLAEMRADDAKRASAARRRDWWMLLLTAAILALTATLVVEVFW